MRKSIRLRAAFVVILGTYALASSGAAQPRAAGSRCEETLASEESEQLDMCTFCVNINMCPDDWHLDCYCNTGQCQMNTGVCVPQEAPCGVKVKVGCFNV